LIMSDPEKIGNNKIGFLILSVAYTIKIF